LNVGLANESVLSPGVPSWNVDDAPELSVSLAAAPNELIAACPVGSKSTPTTRADVPQPHARYSGSSTIVKAMHEGDAVFVLNRS
jgi:hypothetical protein